MPKMALTDLAISKLKLPPSPEQADYWDASDVNLHGFGIRVSYNGTKTFVLMVPIWVKAERKLTRITLGRYDPKGKHGLSLKAAREMARDYRKAAEDGHDPRKEKQERQAKLAEESLNTFSAVRDRFIATHCQQKKQSTARGYERLLRKNCSRWDDLPLAKIMRKDISGLMDEYLAEGKPYKVNRTFSVLRKMLSWAVNRGLIAKSPMEGLKAEGNEAARDRVLSHEEIKLLWRAFEATPRKKAGGKTDDGLFTPVFKLLLLTGQRLGEVVSMRWSELRELDGKDPRWEIPKTRTKNKRPHVVQLTPMAVEIIKAVPVRVIGNASSDLVFTTTGRTTLSGFSRAKERVEKRIAEIVDVEGLEDVFPEGTDWRIHDFRRTVATHMAELGVSIDVIEKVLNHISGSRAGIVGVYNRSELFAERRKALTLWADHLQKLTSHETAEEARKAA